MASFTAVGDNVTLQMTSKGDVAAVAISGTYNMVIQLQREVGSPGSGAYVKLKEWSTANATVAYNHVTEYENEKLRLIVITDTSGTATATLSDTNDALLQEFYDRSGKIREKRYQDGSIFYNTAGEVTLDTRNDEKVIVLADAATYTVLAANSGKKHMIPDLTSDIVITLPTAADGLEYEFWYAGVAADAQDWQFTTGSNTNYFLGGLIHADHDAGSAGDEIVPIAGDGNSNSKVNILTPHVGTVVKMVCDGTNWYLTGTVNSATVPSFADQ